MIDTRHWSSTTVVAHRLVSDVELYEADEQVKRMGVSIVKVHLKGWMKIDCGKKSAEVQAIVVPKLIGFVIDVLIGMDMITHVGGV